jgi:hypothetical protein
MKRGVLILVAGLAAAAVAYGGVYLARTDEVRSMRQSDSPELAWLKEEFRLNDAEFRRISELHAAYLPQCREMCRKIYEANLRLHELLADANQVTPDIDAALAEVAGLRTECQRMMLDHFFTVGQTMPPPQRRRYQSWVNEKIFMPDHGMPQEH